jgi:hypothetical protein
VQARCLKVKRIARVCFCTGPPADLPLRATNWSPERCDTNLWAINVRSIERGLLDRWEDDAGEKSWRSTAVSRGECWPVRGAVSCHMCALSPTARDQPAKRIASVTRRDSSRVQRIYARWVVEENNLQKKTWKMTILIQNYLVSQSGYLVKSHPKDLCQIDISIYLVCTLCKSKKTYF